MLGSGSKPKSGSINKSPGFGMHKATSSTERINRPASGDDFGDGHNGEVELVEGVRSGGRFVRYKDEDVERGEGKGRKGPVPTIRMMSD